MLLKVNWIGWKALLILFVDNALTLVRFRCTMCISKDKKGMIGFFSGSLIGHVFSGDISPACWFGFIIGFLLPLIGTEIDIID